MHGAELLTGVLKFKKPVVHLRENICVLDQLHSAIGYRAVGQELMLTNQQYVLNKVSLNLHKTRLCSDQLMKTL